MNKPPIAPAVHMIDFHPTYHCVAQTNQWNSAIACISSVVKQPIEVVRQLAAKQLKQPADGYWSVSRNHIPELFEHYGWWAASRYRQANTVDELSNLALILLKTSPDHFGLFHRQKFEDGKSPVCYLINPALGIPTDQHMRWDVHAIVPCKYLELCTMAQYMKDFW